MNESHSRRKFVAQLTPLSALEALFDLTFFKLLVVRWLKGQVDDNDDDYDDTGHYVNDEDTDENTEGREHAAEFIQSFLF